MIEPLTPPVTVLLRDGTLARVGEMDLALVAADNSTVAALFGVRASGVFTNWTRTGRGQHEDNDIVGVARHGRMRRIWPAR